ncbi:MAG: ABC transporter permease, partial [Pseudomonadota bacterium]
MPRTTALLAEWSGPDLPGEEVYAAVVADLVEAREIERALPTKVGARVNREISGATSLFKKTNRRAAKLEAPFKEALIEVDKKWGNVAYWWAMKRASESYTPTFLLKSVDLQIADGGGIEWQEDILRIHLNLFVRTLEISLIVTVATLILGYPVAYLLAHLPVRTSNLLLILVLLPFWTSILVRTTAWIAILQGQGALNDIFVWLGVTADDA